ncbi:MAG: CBS domain-containing protein [Casimicrobiaceae bacterium]
MPDGNQRFNCVPLIRANMNTETWKEAPRDASPASVEHDDALLDEALGETFPASDPIAISFQKAPRINPAARSDLRICNDTAGDPSAAANLAVQPTIYGGEALLVDSLLPAARERLVTIADDAPLIQAAKLLRAGTDLVVVCSREGALAGIITKTDVVGVLGDCQGGSCMTQVASVMTRDVVVCGSGELLLHVWSRMKARRLKNIPITDGEGRPVGVLNARDVLQILLREVEDEESLLRDYVMGIGYR